MSGPADLGGRPPGRADSPRVPLAVQPRASSLFRLDGRMALVAGASSGIGARCASVLHEAGADVVITVRRRTCSAHKSIASRGE